MGCFAGRLAATTDCDGSATFAACIDAVCFAGDFSVAFAVCVGAGLLGDGSLATETGGAGFTLGEGFSGGTAARSVLVDPPLPIAADTALVPGVISRTT